MSQNNRLPDEQALSLLDIALDECTSAIGVLLNMTRQQRPMTLEAVTQAEYHLRRALTTTSRLAERLHALSPSDDG